MLETSRDSPPGSGPHPHPESDDALVQAALAGDERAERAIRTRFSPLARRVIGRSLGPEFDIDDVVQDVFLQLFVSLKRLRDPAALRAFVVSICVHNVRTQLRRRRVRRIIGLSSAPEVQDVRVVSVDHESRQALIHFYRALEKLRSRDRTAFVLRYVEGMEVDEVAAALDVSVPTVRRSLAHASDRLSVIARSNDLLASYLRGRV